MKYLLLAFTTLLMNPIASAGPEDRIFTDKDYDEVVSETGVTFKLLGNAEDVLSNNCRKAVLASLADAVFERNREDGEDLDEVIDVVNASYLAKRRAYRLKTYTNRDYLVVTNQVNGQCEANAASSLGEEE